LLRRTKSYDDLKAVSDQDAAESRARAALRQLEEEQARADVLEQELAAAKATAAHNAISVSPDAVTVRRNGKKFVIPFALLMAVTPLVWTVVMDYVELKRAAKEQKDTFATTAARIDTLEWKLSEQAMDNASLRETVAQLSGYLAGVLPKAGVTVPGAAPGASRMAIVSDPLPLGAKRQTPVNVRTPVPAPAPRP
jgi:hypothetical protein